MLPRSSCSRTSFPLRPSNGMIRPDPAVDALPLGRPTTCGGCARPSPPLTIRSTCAAGWARQRSTWRRRPTAPSNRGGAPPSPPGCPPSTGRSRRCTSLRSMPVPVTRSCSTATAASTWWTPSPPAVRAASPTASATVDTSTAATDAAARMPTWQPATGGCWCCHRSAVDRWRRRSGAFAPCRAGRRAPRRWQQGRDDPAGQQLVDAFGDNMMDLSSRPPSARAGFEQGQGQAERLSEFWR